MSISTVREMCMASVVFMLSVWQLPAIAKSPQQIFSEAANSIVIVNTFNSEGREFTPLARRKVSSFQ